MGGWRNTKGARERPLVQGGGLEGVSEKARINLRNPMAGSSV
jgi:hypothetical protein